MAQLTIQQAFDLGLQHHQAGRLAQAEVLYRQILAQEPQHAAALHYLGVIAHQVGRNDAAVDLIGRALAITPGYPEAHYNLGRVLQVMARLDEAIAAYRQAILLSPDYADAHSNLGNVLHATGQLDEAIDACRHAIALRPCFPLAHNNLGNALQAKGRLDEAIAAYREAIALAPDLAIARSNLGNALQTKGQLDEAVAAYRQAIALQPNYPEGHYNLGNALQERKHTDAAIAAYRQAIALRPEWAEAYNNLGNALKDKGRPDEAVGAFRRAITLKPDYPEAFSNLGTALKSKGCLDEAIAAYRQALVLKSDYPEAHSNLVLSLHYHPGFDASAIAQECGRWNQCRRAATEPLKRLIQAPANGRDPERRLRIGYVSPDFREHVVGRFLLPLLEQHDKAQVEVLAYAQVPFPDAMTERLRAHTDAWRSLVGLSDAEASALIRQDRIDILVDLALHTAGNRLLVFAQKPAPVQVTYLAYPGSSGLSTMDYRLSDPHLDPPGGDESVYSEKTIRLPKTYWCYRSELDLPLQPPPALGKGFITFGCLNNFCKVNEPLLSLWARVLRAVPHSRLLLHAQEGDHRQRVRERLQREGIEPDRVNFARMVPLATYFDLYQSIDIALDTCPYGGGTTTCDALWMGVPVVSRAGKTAVDRAGLSILSNVGLPELVARTPEQYLQIAKELADDLPRLKQLRSTLRARMQSSPLMDAAKFARSMEEAYRQMWRTWCATA